MKIFIKKKNHYCDVLMSAMLSQITGVHYLFRHLFRRRSKKRSKLRVDGLCEGNPPVTGGFPSQRASDAGNISIWWCYHVTSISDTMQWRWFWHASPARGHFPAFKIYWGRVTHICVNKLSTIGSDNGLSPGWHQAIIWTNVGILLIGTLGTNLSEILSESHIHFH